MIILRCEKERGYLDLRKRKRRRKEKEN